MPLSRITSPFQSATANVYSPSANTITIRTSNADRVVFDSAGFTGFGAASQINHPFRITARPTTLGASPIAAWDGSTTPGISFNDNYPGVNFNGMYKYNPSGGTYYMGNGSLATIYLDPTSNNSDILISTANTGTANTISSPIERVRFNQFGIGLGQGVPSSGMGIRFPATQASSSDPNTLDDYEEGTWTPQALISVLGASGRYTKIGRVVQWSCVFTFGSSSSGSGAYIGGLPFTCENADSARAGASIGYTDYGSSNITVLFNKNDVSAFFYNYTGGTLTYANLSGKTIFCGGTFLTNT